MKGRPPNKRSYTDQNLLSVPIQSSQTPEPPRSSSDKEDVQLSKSTPDIHAAAAPDPVEEYVEDPQPDAEVHISLADGENEEEAIPQGGNSQHGLLVGEDVSLSSGSYEKHEQQQTEPHGP